MKLSEKYRIRHPDARNWVLQERWLNNKTNEYVWRNEAYAGKLSDFANILLNRYISTKRSEKSLREGIEALRIEVDGLVNEVRIILAEAEKEIGKKCTKYSSKQT